MELRFKQCAVIGCDRNAHRDAEGKLGFCSLHYQRHKRHGDASKVLKTPSPAIDWLEENVAHVGDECLRWPFAIGDDGYGRVHRPRGPLTTAAHLMCEMRHGPKPSNRHECAHSCGMGHEACVNPKHLYWATPSENQNERVKHGTSNRGTRQWQAKLTEQDVRSIRKLFGSKSLSEIAGQFGVSRGAIKDIQRGKNWAWLL